MRPLALPAALLPTALLSAAVLLAAPAPGADLRIATFHSGLTRRDPGLLVQDLLHGDAQVDQVLGIISRIRPDILLLTEIDHDTSGIALALLADRLRVGRGASAGLVYPWRFTAPVNAGMPSGRDRDGDGHPAGPGDALSFGYFPGQQGMALLSRFPIDPAASRSFRELPWQDGLPLAATSIWDLVLTTPQGPLHILAANPVPPVFDRGDGMNRRRNAAEITWLARYLSGEAFADDRGVTAALGPGAVILLGDLNADPADGAGDHTALAALLTHPRLQDPEPESEGARAAALRQGGANSGQAGDPARDTADWPDDPGKPGNLRVDYVLPDRAFLVTGSGVFWPAPGSPDFVLIDPGIRRSARHRLVWADLRPGPGA